MIRKIITIESRICKIDRFALVLENILKNHFVPTMALLRGIMHRTVLLVGRSVRKVIQTNNNN